MPFRMLPARPIVVAAAILGLTACANLARPGNELWPYDGGEAEGMSGPASASPEAGDVAAESGPAVLFTPGPDGPDKVFLGNRSADRTITVLYHLEGDPTMQATCERGTDPTRA